MRQHGAGAARAALCLVVTLIAAFWGSFVGAIVHMGLVGFDGLGELPPGLPVPFLSLPLQGALAGCALGALIATQLWKAAPPNRVHLGIVLFVASAFVVSCAALDEHGAPTLAVLVVTTIAVCVLGEILLIPAAEIPGESDAVVDLQP